MFRPTDTAYVAGKFEKKTIEFLRTTKGKLGVPFLFENTLKIDTKKITKIFDGQGNPKTPVYVSFNNNLSIIPITDDDLLLKIFYDDAGVGVSILRVLEVDKYSNEALVEVLYRKSNNSTEASYNQDAILLDGDVLAKIEDILTSLMKGF